MSDTPNRGAFYIKAEDVNSTDSFTVPGDQAGFTPDDTENPSQPSYSIDNRQRKYRKQYYVHIKNGWDTQIDVALNGSSYDDKNMAKKVIEQPSETLSTGTPIVFEDFTGHSFLEVEISGILNVPTNGVLEIVIQDRL